MNTKIWIKQKTNSILNSIAFIPSLVILFFLLLSGAMIYLDFTETGKSLKSATEWIRLKDPSTARTIVSVIVAGIISITVFSFTMVMVVLNQAASQLSNRVLDKLVGNRFHQFLIGFYTGVIIFGLLLLTSIRDIESGIYVPALSTYLLILLAVICLLLFVFFLNSITQSVKYTTIIKGIYTQTFSTMKEICVLKEAPTILEIQEGQLLYSTQSGIFESFDKTELLALADEHNYILSFKYAPGHFIMKGVPIMEVYCTQGLMTKAIEKELLSHLLIIDISAVDTFFYSGFKQLSEIAIKALSPGINDPGTASESLQALFVLLAYRINHFPNNYISNAEGQLKIITK